MPPSSYGRTSFQSTLQAGGETDLLLWPEEPCARPCADEGQDNESVVVQVDYDVPKPINPNLDSIDEAFLSYSWGGIMHALEADIGRGTPITLTGNRLSVKAHYPKVAANVQPPTTQPDIVIRVSLGKGQGGGSPGIAGSLRRTVKIPDLVIGQQSVFLPIPRWAVAVNFSCLELGNFSLVLEQNEASASNVALAVSTIGKGSSETVPIVNGARYVRITASNGLPVTRGRLNFYLGAG